MIINRGQNNELIVSVTEMTTLSAPVNYLWEFINKDTKVKSYCISNPITFYGQRESFNIVETDTPIPSTNQVKLTKGDYQFRIYQQVSSTNINPANTTPSTFYPYVEIGLLSVGVPVFDNTEYVGATLTNTVYEG